MFAGNGFDVNYSEPVNGTYQLDFTLGNYELDEVTLNGVVYNNILFDGSVTTMKQGFAELPFISATVRLFANKNVSLQVIEGDYEEYQLENPLVPSRGVIYRDQDPASIPYVISNSSLTDDWYPLEMATSTEPFIMKDIRGTSVYVYPFRYNAVQNTLRVYKTLTVQLIENETNSINPLLSKSESIVREMDGIYNSIFINYNETKDDLTIGEYGDILVISTDRDETAIQSYIDWKREKGYNVFLEIVPTNTNVSTLVQESYDANNNILYVQLVGDWPDIKSNLLSGYAPMDPQLGCVVGSDEVADITIGRFSANSPTDVTNQVDKIITYEQNPDLSGTWYKGALGIGSNEGAGNGDDGEMDKVHLQVIWDDKLDPFTFDDYYTGYDPGANVSDVYTALENGVSVINYTGHGYPQGWSTTGFSNSNVSSLTNGDMLPWAVSVACNNGDFHGSGDCFAEAWQKKTGGGSVMFLAATISQPWQPPMRGQDYFMDILIGGYDYSAHPGQNGISTTEQRTTLGTIVFNGLALMTTESGGSSDWETAKTWHLFGDPSLQARTDQPGLVTLSTDVVMAGIDFSTTVSGPDGPFEGAMVCISNGTDYFSEITDASGNVTISHTLTPGSAKLVVTGFNLETIYDDITVASSNQAWIVIDDCVIDDSNGNNNGLADFGESILLNVSAENVGSLPASGITATISTDDSYIVISDDNHYFGDIASGQVVTGDGAFSFDVELEVPDGHTVILNVEFTDDTKELWTGTISVTLHAPVLTIGGYMVDDSNGNSNGRLDPGENVDIIIPNLNEGSCDALDAIASAVSGSGLITINNATYNVGTIAAGGSQDAIINITVSSSAQIGDVASMNYTVESDPYSATTDIVMTIGLVVEDFESGNFESYEWEFGGNADWVITDSDVYEGAYSAKSGNIGDSQNSQLLITIDVTADDQISFFRKVSSEGNYDYLRFYIDGVQQGAWDGEVDWAEVSYPVTAGEHTFKWAFEKDGSVSNGSDCGWIDYILFPPFAGGAAPLSVTASANPSEICAGESSQLNAFAMGGTGVFEYEWDPATGLDDPNIQSPIATPESTTTYTVTVDDGNTTISNSITVTVHDLPETPIITQNADVLESSAMTGNQWYDSNGEIDGATGQTYEPQSTGDYYVIVSNEFDCESEPSNVIYVFITGLIDIIEKINVNIYPNPTSGEFFIEMNLEKENDLKIQVLNSIGEIVINRTSFRATGFYKTSINMNQMNKGLYFIVIESNEGRAAHRLIVK